MSEDHSSSPPTSGVQMEPVQATNASESVPSSVDMLALGFGLLTMESNQDPNKQSVVRANYRFAIAGGEDLQFIQKNGTCLKLHILLCITNDATF